jgi:hypothetical protein
MPGVRGFVGQTCILSAVALAAAALPANQAGAQTVNPAQSQPIAPLAGRDYTPAAGQGLIGFYGTDLGFTLKHEGNLRIVFGDTWGTKLGTPISPIGDDAQGLICLQAAGCPYGGVVLATGDQVVAYAGNAQEVRDRRGPPIVFRRNLFGKTASIVVYPGGPLSIPLTMGEFDTPAAVFSNGLSGSESGAYSIFVRNEAVTCTTTCSGGFTCDKGVLGTTLTGGPCLLGTLGCIRPAFNGGLCVDPTSPRRDPSTPAGRLRGVVLRERVGNADPTLHEVYYTKQWDTHKFINPTSVTVENYALGPVVGHMRVGSSTVTNPNPSAAPANGSEVVFIWGRPWFLSSSAAQAKLYLAAVPLPKYSGSGSFQWKPWFYAGKDEAGYPRFSDLETDAVALPNPNLDTTETYDMVNQQTVRWIPQLNKWVMLYGGDSPDEVFLQGLPVTRDPQTPVLVRFADNPWGPWTVSVPIFYGGNAATATGTYAPGGISHSAACTGPTCAPAELALNVTYGRDEPGHLYSANIIPEWTVDRGATIDLFWNISTYAPYQVFLMRSTITK